MGGNKALRRNSQNSVQTHQISAIYSGPIPPPDLFRQYDEVLPGAAERILAMAERQSEHRQKMETTVINGDDKRATQGQLCGFIVAMTTVIGGFILIALGKDGIGISTIFGSLATLTGMFIYGSISRRKEREKKLAEAKK